MACIFRDSINLRNGKYEKAPLLTGIQDFLSQLKDSNKGNAELAAPELPYELLRRSARYEVRRYPATVSFLLVVSPVRSSNRNDASDCG